MDMRRVAMKSFVLLQATWLVEQCSQRIKQWQPSHVIVHRLDSRDAYYLFSAQEALTLFARSSSVFSVHEALRLDERNTTPTVESDTDAEQAPDQCIVLEKGQLVGFFDVTIPPQWRAHRGKGEILPSEKQSSELRTLVAEFPERIQLQAVFSLLVSLSASSIGATGVTLPLTLPPGTSLDIIVRPVRGFAFDGRNEGTLIVTDEQETSLLQFKLRGVTVGPGQILVSVFHQGKLLCSLPMDIDVLEATKNTSAQLLGEEQPREPVRIHQPDLSLLILEQRNTGSQH